MRIRIVAPIIGDWFLEETKKEAEQFKAPDTMIDVVGLDKGPASIESAYDEVLASPHIVERVRQAEADGCDGVFITCFGDPGVEASREMVSIPVVGGFQPAALTASLIAGRWSVVTVLKSVVPLLRGLARKAGLEGNIASIRDINTPVLELSNKELMQSRLLEQIEQAVSQDGAEAVVLGCTGMLGLGESLRKALTQKGIAVPIVEPTAAAIGMLESLVRSRISHSKLAYPTPPAKERVA